MKLTERDKILFRHLASYGCLLTSQITMIFDWHLKVAQKRLRKLRVGGYLSHVQLAGYGNRKSEYLWFLSTRGAEFVGAPYCKPRQTIRLSHQLQNNGLLIGISRYFQYGRITCLVLPEHLMRQAGLPIIPDGSFLLTKEESSALFLLENDGGSEILSSASLHNDIRLKLLTYSRMFEEDDIDFFRRFFNMEINRFRLLLIAPDARRADSIADIAKEHDRNGFVWITTRPLFDRKGAAGEIWHVPATGKFDQSIVGKG